VAFIDGRYAGWHLDIETAFCSIERPLTFIASSAPGANSMRLSNIDARAIFLPVDRIGPGPLPRAQELGKRSSESYFRSGAVRAEDGLGRAATAIALIISEPGFFWCAGRGAPKAIGPSPGASELSETD
jgi:hypothetical protein